MNCERKNTTLARKKMTELRRYLPVIKILIVSWEQKNDPSACENIDKLNKLYDIIKTPPKLLALGTTSKLDETLSKLSEQVKLKRKKKTTTSQTQEIQAVLQPTEHLEACPSPSSTTCGADQNSCIPNTNESPESMGQDNGTKQSGTVSVSGSSIEPPIPKTQPGALKITSTIPCVPHLTRRDPRQHDCGLHHCIDTPSSHKARLTPDLQLLELQYDSQQQPCENSYQLSSKYELTDGSPTTNVLVSDTTLLDKTDITLTSLKPMLKHPTKQDKHELRIFPPESHKRLRSKLSHDITTLHKVGLQGVASKGIIERGNMSAAKLASLKPGTLFDLGLAKDNKPRFVAKRNNRLTNHSINQSANSGSIDPKSRGHNDILLQEDFNNIVKALNTYNSADNVNVNANAMNASQPFQVPCGNNQQSKIGPTNILVNNNNTSQWGTLQFSEVMCNSIHYNNPSTNLLNAPNLQNNCTMRLNSLCDQYKNTVRTQSASQFENSGSKSQSTIYDTVTNSNIFNSASSYRIDYPTYDQSINNLSFPTPSIIRPVAPPLHSLPAAPHTHTHYDRTTNIPALTGNTTNLYPTSYYKNQSQLTENRIVRNENCSYRDWRMKKEMESKRLLAQARGSLPLPGRALKHCQNNSNNKRNSDNLDKVVTYNLNNRELHKTKTNLTDTKHTMKETAYFKQSLRDPRKRIVYPDATIASLDLKRTSGQSKGQFPEKYYPIKKRNYRMGRGKNSRGNDSNAEPRYLRNTNSHLTVLADESNSNDFTTSVDLLCNNNRTAVTNTKPVEKISIHEQNHKSNDKPRETLGHRKGLASSDNFSLSHNEATNKKPDESNNSMSGNVVLDLLKITNVEDQLTTAKPDQNLINEDSSCQASNTSCPHEQLKQKDIPELLKTMLSDVGIHVSPNKLENVVSKLMLELQPAKNKLESESIGSSHSKNQVNQFLQVSSCDTNSEITEAIEITNKSSPVSSDKSQLNASSVLEDRGEDLCKDSVLSSGKKQKGTSIVQNVELKDKLHKGYTPREKNTGKEETQMETSTRHDDPMIFRSQNLSISEITNGNNKLKTVEPNSLKKLLPNLIEKQEKRWKQIIESQDLQYDSKDITSVEEFFPSSNETLQLLKEYVDKSFFADLPQQEDEVIHEMDSVIMPQTQSHESCRSEGDGPVIFSVASLAPDRELIYPVPAAVPIDSLPPILSDPYYKCEYKGCTFETRQPESLTDHRRQCEYRESKPLTCTKCEGVFETSSAIVSHMVSHGPICFRCSMCSFTALISSDVSSHMKNVHNVNKTCLAPADPLADDCYDDTFLIIPDQC